MLIRNYHDLITVGRLTKTDYGYLTDDGRELVREWTGRRCTTLRWRVKGRTELYRDLWDAYYAG